MIGVGVLLYTNLAQKINHREVVEPIWVLMNTVWNQRPQGWEWVWDMVHIYIYVCIPGICSSNFFQWIYCIYMILGIRMYMKGYKRCTHSNGMTPTKQATKKTCLFLFTSAPLKIMAILAGLMFSVPALPWTPIDHVELFAGCCSVTLGEQQDLQRRVGYIKRCAAYRY